LREERERGEEKKNEERGGEKREEKGEEGMQKILLLAYSSG